jgi:type VI secretion system protein ImpM
MSNALAVGFYGKLPILGDFVRRQVADRTVVAWDAWLQQALAASRDRLGDEWQELYLTAPMWRFFAQPGVLDEQPVGGVLFPSVDRVGRHFPFTVFARLPRRCVGLVVADRCAAWFERVEDLVLAHLDDETRTVDALDEAIGATADRLAAAIDTLPENMTPGGLHDPGSISEGCLHLPLGDRLDVTPTALMWLEKSISHAMSDAVFWWSSGSTSVRPSWLITRGLPEPRAFSAMLSGAWDEWPWQSRAPAARGVPPPPEMLPATPPMQIESAGSTHPGRVRDENQDAYVARPEVGLWAVADGMGGHSAGQLASRTTVDALASVEQKAMFPEFVRVIRETLEGVNAHLYSLSQRAVNPTVIGTTLVALMVREGTGVCLWAGDSRLYRLRRGELEQLTIDHSEAVELTANAETAPTNVITRALGGQPEIDIAQLSFDVRDDDRFLLCSDGLHGELSPEAIAELMSGQGAAGISEALIARVLQGKAADNVTVVVVHAHAGADSADTLITEMRWTPPSSDGGG